MAGAAPPAPWHRRCRHGAEPVGLRARGVEVPSRSGGGRPRSSRSCWCWLALAVAGPLQRLTPAAFVRHPRRGAGPGRARPGAAAAAPASWSAAAGRHCPGAAGRAEGCSTSASSRPSTGRSTRSSTGLRRLRSGCVHDSIGRGAATVLLVVGALLVVAVLVLMPLAVVPARPAGVGAARRAPARRGRALGRVAAAGPARPAGVAAVRSRRPARRRRLRAGQPDPRRAAGPAAVRDVRRGRPAGQRPADRLLTGLRGKDVLFVFVESYGRVAVQGSAVSPGVDAVLDAGTRRLHAAGFSLAQRVPDLADLRRRQLARALDPAVRALGGQPAALRPPGDQRPAHAEPRRSGAPAGAPSPTCRPTPGDWPQGAFYGYDQRLRRAQRRLPGPTFSYPRMPDQYTPRRLPAPGARPRHRRR